MSRRVKQPSVPEAAAVDSVAPVMQNSKPHSHRCQDCGTIWTHGEMMAGDVEAHTCPKCRKPGQWRVYQGGQAPTQEGKLLHMPEKQFLGLSREMWGLFLFVVAAVIWGNLLYSLASGE